MSKLRKYGVSASVTISIYTVVAARSKADAIRKAGDLPMGGVHHDTYQDPIDDEVDDGSWSEWRTTGELDGEPQELRAEAER